jgi:hypothetical protein
MFGSVVAVAFQRTFRVEMHQNDFFYFFKKSFLISAHQNDLKHTKKVNFFFGTQCKRSVIVIHHHFCQKMPMEVLHRHFHWKLATKIVLTAFLLLLINFLVMKGHQNNPVISWIFCMSCVSNKMY